MSDRETPPQPEQESEHYRTSDGTGDPGGDRPDTPPAQLDEDAIAARLEDAPDDRP